jgi:hypothetical protein
MTKIYECRMCLEFFESDVNEKIGYRNEHDNDSEWQYVSRRLHNTYDIEIVPSVCERHQKLLNILAANRNRKYL